MKLRSSILLAATFIGMSLAFGADRRHPLEGARVGAWVLERSVASGARKADDTSDKDTAVYTQRWVARVDGRRVAVDSQVVSCDATRGIEPALASWYDLDDENCPFGTYSETDEEILVGPRKVRCSRIETRALTDERGRKLVTTQWVSDLVPVLGLVRSTTVDEDRRQVARTDLVDFGETGGAERPIAPGTDGIDPKRP